MMTPDAACSFTGLETIMLAILSAFISSVLLILAMTKKFMLRSECALQHKSNAETDAAIRKDIAKVILSQNLTFMMLRAIIVHLDLPPDTKSNILNMTSQKGSE